MHPSSLDGCIASIRESSRESRRELTQADFSRYAGCAHLHNHIRGSIVVSISACHAEDPGSIPGRGACSDLLADGAR